MSNTISETKTKKSISATTAIASSIIIIIIPSLTFLRKVRI
jgi:hypothetical protein